MAQHVLRSSLQRPDTLEWHSLRHYAPAAGESMTQAYTALQRLRDDSDAYWEAYVALIPLRSLTLCLPQHLNVEYALALTYTADGSIPQALESLERAIDVAQLLHDLPALVELHYLAGAASYMLTEFVDALDHNVYGLTYLRALATSPNPVDPQFELDFLLRIAALKFELAHYREARDSLDEARAIRETWLPSSPLIAATINWTHAQLNRWTGFAGNALHVGIATADVFRQCGSSINAGRMCGIVADTALDLAETYASDALSQARLTYLEVSRTYCKLAQSYARDANDSVGQSLARLTQINWTRQTGRNRSTLAELEKVRKAAARSADPALHGKVLTALADEYAERGERESARHCYLRAWRELEERELRAIADWTHRKFLRFEEMGTESAH
ncbi:MAG: hypothetical protein ACRDHE_14725 [Ktedonobacterales bacterium]